jgi:hypothetical protein
MHTKGTVPLHASSLKNLTLSVVSLNASNKPVRVGGKRIQNKVYLVIKMIILDEKNMLVLPECVV